MTAAVDCYADDCSKILGFVSETELCDEREIFPRCSAYYSKKTQLFLAVFLKRLFAGQPIKTIKKHFEENMMKPSTTTTITICDACNKSLQGKNCGKHLKAKKYWNITGRRVKC